MAKEDIVKYRFDKRTAKEHHDIAVAGGKASGEARRKKSTFKNAIKWLAESDLRITEGKLYDMYKEQGIDISNLSPTELATIGLWFGAITGKNENFKTLMEGNNEIKAIISNETPEIKINIVDNTDLERAMYLEGDNK